MAEAVFIVDPPARRQRLARHAALAAASAGVATFWAFLGWFSAQPLLYPPPPICGVQLHLAEDAAALRAALAADSALAAACEAHR